jgi:hypothetical protein
MDLSWNDITDWASAEASSLAKDLSLALLAAILTEHARRRFAARKRGTTGSDDDASASSRAWNGLGRSRGDAAANAHAQSVQSFTRLTSDPPKLTREQEADLIDSGLPERLVRAATLDYASLTSGCMADRIRSGYA